MPIPDMATATRLIHNIDQRSAAAITSARRSTANPAGIAFLTDSIGAFQSSSGQAWHRIMCSLSNGAMMWRGYFGTAGYTLAQIRDTHLPQVLAMSPLPGVVGILGGTNDLGSASYNEANSRIVLLDIIARLQAAGIKPLLWTVPPRDDSTTVNGYVQRWNVWVRYLAASLGLPLIDAHSFWVDESTGLWATPYRLDDVHPNRFGHFALGKAMATNAQLLKSFPFSSIYLSASKGADPNLIAANARFFDAGLNGATSPNNWTGVGIGTGSTGSVVTDAAIPGNWFRFTKSNAQGSAQNLIRAEVLASGGAFAVGDTVSFAVRFRVNAAEDATGSTANIALNFRTDAAAISSVSAFSAGGDTLDGIAYVEAVVPATCTRIRAEMDISGTPAVEAWVQYAQPTLLNLTALGIA